MRSDDAAPTLQELFNREGSDKGDYYAKTYEILLRDFRPEVRRLLEIGIGTMLPGPSSMLGYASAGYRPGASLRAWRAYFPNAQIVGVDIQPDTQVQEERIRTFLCDSTDAESVEQLREKLPVSSFQIIIDDGSHVGEHQLATLKHFWPLLDDGGFYLIEDIGPGSLLFDKPSEVEAIIGRADYFSVMGWAPIVDWTPTVENSSPTRAVVGLARRLLRRLLGVSPPPAPLNEGLIEWKLLVIRKTRAG